MGRLSSPGWRSGRCSWTSWTGGEGSGELGGGTQLSSPFVGEFFEFPLFLASPSFLSSPFGFKKSAMASGLWNQLVQLVAPEPTPEEVLFESVVQGQSSVLESWVQAGKDVLNLLVFVFAMGAKCGKPDFLFGRGGLIANNGKSKHHSFC